MMRTVKHISIAIIALLIILGIRECGSRTEVPRQLELTSATSGWSAANFSVGKGHHYHFVLSFPKGTRPNAKNLSGSVVLMRRGSEIVSFPFDLNNAMRVSWLGLGVDGYALTWGAPVNLDTVLTSGALYTVAITFSNESPRVGALWLC